MDYGAWNRALLERLSVYLNGHERAIDAASVRELMQACSLSAQEAFAFLLASLFGLETDTDPEHRAAFEAYFPEMVRCLDPAVYRADPYYSSVHIPAVKTGRWELRTQKYAPGEGFVCGDLIQKADGRLIAPIGFFMEEFSYPCVLEEGREWMLITPNEIETMKSAVDAASGRVLAYGLGLGYFAFMAARKSSVESVTVVERDPNVIRLFCGHILPQFPCRDKIRIVEADAFDYARRTAPAAQYDLIFTDLWHDAGDGLPLYRRMKALEHLAPQARHMYWIEPTLRAYL